MDYESVTYHGEDWEKDVPKVALDFANLPYLIDGDVKITQTWAIYPYIAQKAGREDLLGNSIQDKARVSMLRGMLYDFLREIWYEVASDKDWREKKEKHYENYFGYRLDNIAKYIGKKEYLIGYLTVADIYAYEVLQYAKGMFNEHFRKYNTLN